MKKLLAIALMAGLAGSASATGSVRGDSIYLFNSGSTGSGFAGFWVLAANDGAAAPVHNISSWVSFNDVALTPTPNIPMVGDYNGDGVSDVAGHGKDPSNNTIMLGRNTAATTNVAPGILQGDLFDASVGDSAWPTNWTPFWLPTGDEAGIDYTHYFMADVDGDGKDDAVAVKPTWWDSGATTYFLAQHSDAEGLEGNGPASTWAAGILNPHAVNTPLMGDFNGDGAADLVQQNNTNAFLHGMVSTLGVGLDGANATFWGSMGFAPNHIVTLIGDIDGDGRDDIVQVDDRDGTGGWVWVAGLTVTNGDPAGIGLIGSGLSWAAPFSLHTNSISATPLLADMDNDGRDDLVLYEEYLDAGTSNVWGRLLTSLTDDPAGGLFSNGFDFSSTYDYVGAFGSDASGMIPVVGNVHVGGTDHLGQYLLWAGGFGLSESNAALDLDFELDGLDNLTEYALGGDPTADDAASISPTFTGPVDIGGGTNVMEYVYSRRLDDDTRGLIYGLTVTADDLILNDWTSIAEVWQTGFGPIDADFESVTNEIPTGTPIGFVNLEVTSDF